MILNSLISRVKRVDNLHLHRAVINALNTLIVVAGVVDGGSIKHISFVRHSQAIETLVVPSVLEAPIQL